MENIIVNNANFVIDDKNGCVTIDRSLSCKIIDFGLAELFKIEDVVEDKKYFEYDVDDEKLGAFHVNNKYSIASSHQCPQIFNEEVYDARKADIWSFGVILFYMAHGVYPYHKQLATDSGFWSLKHHKIDLFLVCLYFLCDIYYTLIICFVNVL